MASLVAIFTDRGLHCRYSLFMSLKRASPVLTFSSSVLGPYFFGVSPFFLPILTSSHSGANWAKCINQIFFSPFPCQDLPAYQFVIFCCTKDPLFLVHSFTSSICHTDEISLTKIWVQQLTRNYKFWSPKYICYCNSPFLAKYSHWV